MHASIKVASLLYTDLSALTDGYRNQKAGQDELCQEASSEVRDLNMTVVGEGFREVI